MFITFEGIEGSGKSTHAKALAAHLRAGGHDVVETREPGDTAAGAAVRRLVLGPEAVPLTALTELLLYCADRSQHVSEVIAPALGAGRIVICDRYSDSTIAYQGYGRGVDLATVRALDAHARGDTTPALTFLLDCPPDVGLARARARAQAADRFEQESIAFHERVRAGFHRLAAEAPLRIVVVDSTGPAAEVRRRIGDETARRMAKPS